MDSPTPRRRVPPTTENDNDGSQELKPREELPKTSRESSIDWLDILRGIFGLLILSAATSWFVTGDSIIWGFRDHTTVLGAAKRWFGGPISLTDDELSLYNGTDPAIPIYVGLNGSIYDVSASAHTYGPGGSYHFFAGRDAARGYLTGCFQEDLTPDLRGVEEMFIPLEDPNEKPLSKVERKLRREKDLRIAKKRVEEGIKHWVDVFRGETGRPYFYVGEIKREKGWLKKLPRRELCHYAKEARPLRKDAEAENAGKD